MKHLSSDTHGCCASAPHLLSYSLPLPTLHPSRPAPGHAPQVTSTEEGAFICVWDTRTGSQPEGPAAARELVRLPFDKDARGFCALAFSPTGTRLVAVAQDNYHSVYVYDWRKKRELFSGRGTMGDPPQVRARVHGHLGAVHAEAGAGGCQLQGSRQNGSEATSCQGSS